MELKYPSVLAQYSKDETNVSVSLKAKIKKIKKFITAMEEQESKLSSATERKKQQIEEDISAAKEVINELDDQICAGIIRNEASSQRTPPVNKNNQPPATISEEQKSKLLALNYTEDDIALMSVESAENFIANAIEKIIEVSPEKTNPEPTTISEQQRGQLLALQYTQEDIDVMPLGLAVSIITNSTQKVIEVNAEEAHETPATSEKEKKQNGNFSGWLTLGLAAVAGIGIAAYSSRNKS